MGRLRAWLERRRVTTPPRVLPLIGIGVVGMIVGGAALDLAFAVVEPASRPLRGDTFALVPRTTQRFLLQLVLELMLLIAASLLLRRFVAGWVAAQPPDPRAKPREDQPGGLGSGAVRSTPSWSQVSTLPRRARLAVSTPGPSSRVVRSERIRLTVTTSGNTPRLDASPQARPPLVVRT